MKVILVYKRSVYEQEIRDTPAEKLLSRKDRSVEQVLHAHHQHNDTLDRVNDWLTGHGVKVDARHRTDVSDDDRCDLWITVGGDGTFLNAARHCLDTPIFGINSSVSTSVGFFCAADIDSFASSLAMILDGRQKVRIRYERLGYSLDGRPYRYPVLNDLLVADDCPAALSRYYLGFKGISEFQRSSGIWVGTPAGSGAAIASAGGRKLKPSSRKLQFVVREPYRVGRSLQWVRQSFSGAEKLEIKSAMKDGRIFVDGTLDSEAFGLGAVLEIGRSEHPLNSY